jgi:GT2 family glycosyltransferase
MAPQYTDPRFHVIVVPWSKTDYLEACLAAVLGQTMPPAAVTLFDNALAGGGVCEQVARAFPQVRLMRSPIDLGFSGGNNRAAAAMRDADFILLLDPDTVPALDLIETLARAFAGETRAGVLGCKLLDRDVETIRHLGIELSGNAIPEDIDRGLPDRGQFTGIREVAGTATTAMAVRAELWRELGGLDESFEPPFFEGLDFCFRARQAGWRVAVACEATVTHFRPWAPRRYDSRERLEMFFRSRARFMRKHYGPLDWLTRYLPAELRWMTNVDSKGMRGLALKMLAGGKR